MAQYQVFIQATADEVLQAEGLASTVAGECLRRPEVSAVVIAFPDGDGIDAAVERCRQWGVTPFVGDRYNVARRLVQAWEAHGDRADPFVVRTLLFWRNIDFDYVAAEVAAMRSGAWDAVLPARDFEYTMAADVASVDALRTVAGLEGDDPDTVRARFNPWSYIEFRQEGFRLKLVEPAPNYGPERIAEVLAHKRAHPENEFVGRDYSGTRYHGLMKHFRPQDVVLDMACGSGQGSALLAEHVKLVVGVDYLATYVEAARSRYPETDRLRFIQGDGASVLPLGAEGAFDVVLTLHTLEHVPDDAAMMRNIRRNIRPGGRLIAEVPIQAAKPLGVPVNPYHLREYTVPQFRRLVEEGGFRIVAEEGCCRGFYGDPAITRDAYRIFAELAG
ncbi:MAG: class I SAM-dependent methyltransferase [Rhodospirillaceae bacterium]